MVAVSYMSVSGRPNPLAFEPGLDAVPRRFWLASQDPAPAPARRADEGVVVVRAKADDPVVPPEQLLVQETNETNLELWVSGRVGRPSYAPSLVHLAVRRPAPVENCDRTVVAEPVIGSGIADTLALEEIGQRGNLLPEPHIKLQVDEIDCARRFR